MGGETPANREPIWASGYNTSAELYQTAKTLNTARNTMISLTNTSSTTYISSQAQTLYTDTNHLCQVKGPTGHQIVSCVVNQSSSGSKYQLSIGGFSAGDAVVELLTCTTDTADSTGNVTMYMDQGQPKAYMLQSNLNATGLCNSTQDAATASKDAAAGLRSSLTLLAGMAVAAVMVTM